MEVRGSAQEGIAAMSVKSVDAFFERVAEDKSLRSKMNGLHVRIVRDSRQTSAAEIVRIASAAGFEFTAADWHRRRNAKAKKASKAELAGVTGQRWCEGSLEDDCTSNHECPRESWY